MALDLRAVRIADVEQDRVPWTQAKLAVRLENHLALEHQVQLRSLLDVPGPGRRTITPEERELESVGFQQACRPGCARGVPQMEQAGDSDPLPKHP